MDQVLQLTSSLGANMVTFGAQLNAALFLLGPITVRDFSLTASHSVYTAVVTYTLGGGVVGAFGMHSVYPSIDSWQQADAYLQANPSLFALFVRSVALQDDRDITSRKILVLTNEGAPGALPNGGIPLFIAQADALIPVGDTGNATLIDANGGVSATRLVYNAGNAAWPADARAYAFLSPLGVWTAVPGCC